MTSTATDLETIRDSFGFFDSWEDKYRFVIELGKDLPTLDDSEKIDNNLIRGCQSQVWLVAAYNPRDHSLKLQIDSDAHIVRGLIAIVLAAYDRHTPEEILAFDIEGLFAELELLGHLSQTRGNGLRAMVAKVREVAQSNAQS
jgi:cysteine desulfuration protein SufE